MISSINIRQQFMPKILIKFSFFHLIRFRVDNDRIFQRDFMNLNMTVGDGASQVD